MVGESYEVISAPVKWILIINMMLGRLELFTILVLFHRITGADRYFSLIG